MHVETFFIAKTPEEAYQKRLESKKNRLLAGGAWLKISVKEIDTLISLEDLELDYIKKNDDFIEIGAMTSLRTLETDDRIGGVYDGILSHAISKIMGVGVRNLATIGGSIMGKFAFSDILPVLLVMDARLNFHHHGQVMIEDFLNDRKYQEDLLLSLTIKNKHSKAYFKNVATTHLDFSMINLAIVKDDKIKIAVGSRPGLAIRCHQTESVLKDEQKINEALETLIEEAGLGDNLRASKAYRETLLKTYFLRGIKQVIS